MKINPYLGFNGDCRAAFAFYEQCLGGQILMMLTYADGPMAEQMPPDQRDWIMHARMVVDGDVLMGSDAPGGYVPPAGIFVSLNIDDPAEADRVFAALADGGSVRMPIQETFWAKRFAMLTDRFGTPWMINCEKTP